MSTVAEIKSAIKRLNAKQLRSVGDLVDELREEQWDRQIEADARAGKLDQLMEEAKQDFLMGRCKPFA